MVCAAINLFVLCVVSAQPQAIPDKVKPAAYPFAPSRVKLLDSPFKVAQEADKKYLLSLEPERFLSWFRKNAGLEPKAQNYGGWENQQLAGHSLGHYLTACATMFQSTGDTRLKDKVDTIVAGLKECQDKRGDGYIAALPGAETLWATIKANGQLRGRGSHINGYWAPWYTLHKQYAGLLDAYTLCGNKMALEVCKKFADWAIDETSNLTPENWQNMLDGEFGGMAESLADLYGLTGERKYLDLANKFHHSAVMDPLEKGERKLAGLHGNTQIPKAIGAAREYELTGEVRFRKIAKNFWDQVIEDHTYVIGGNTSGEIFGPPKQLSNRLTDNACETCNTYNMLKLTRHLFTWSPSGKLGDYTERALLNHILASQNPETGMMCYYVSMQPGGRKAFSSPTNDFWCCVGTGMENHARYSDSLYFHNGNKLWVNLFIPSMLDWKEQGVQVKQQSAVDGSRTTLTFTCQKPVRADVLVRIPAWSAIKPEVRVQGELTNYRTREGFAVLDGGMIKTGLKIEVRFFPTLRIEPTPDDPKKAAICFGPLVLAGVWDSGTSQPGSQSPVPAMVTSGKPLSQWIVGDPSDPGTFRTTGVGQPVDVKLMPFYRVVNQRYSVYWDLLSEADYAKREADRKAEAERLAELDSRSIDQVRTGFQNSERTHNLQSDRSSTGDFNGRRYRHADGWFSYELKVDPDGPNELMLTFWGSDGGRAFDVLIDDKVLDTVRLRGEKVNAFFDKVWRLDPSTTKGKSKVTVKLLAHQGSIAGGLFGVRMVRSKVD
ncbi:MAG: glycoside hydrolase family 127 protein [Armatimonadetes bacterium]|nr:glycoside hydrolase family 127 protein [Armatimonadota bacterium]